MTYGQTAPNFTASLVPPAGDPALGAAPYYVSIDGVNYGGVVNYQGPPYILTLRGSTVPLAAGQHTITASYVSPNYGVLTSAPITLTVLKASPSNMECYIGNTSATILPSTPLTVVVGPTGLSGGAFSVTFTGPHTFTSPAAALDANSQFAAVSPPAPGVYQAVCNFSGNAQYSSLSVPMNNRQVTVSAGQTVGGIALYTNPAPLVFNAPTTWRVIVAAQRGLPTPSGYVSLRIGSSFTKILQLGPDGTLTFDATCPGFGPSDEIQVSYSGDAVYAAKLVYFSTATRPIQAGSNASSSTPQGVALPATGSPSAAPSGKPSLSPSPTSLPSLVPALGRTLGAASNRISATWYFAGGVGLLALLAAGAGLALYRRRRSSEPLSPD